jgi:hypothetical protein
MKGFTTEAMKRLTTVNVFAKEPGRHRARLTLRAATLILLWVVACFACMILTGYGLNLLGWAANPVWIFLLVALASFLFGVWLTRQRVQVTGTRQRALELAGFLLVTLGTWIYFVFPALPTLLPPTYSVDAVNHLAFAHSVYSTGQIIEDYPGGVALLTATIAHWVGCPPLRVFHPLTSLWVALTAGAIYALTCFTLPESRANKIVAFAAVFALFVPRDYLYGMLIAEQYYATQVFAQLNVAAFVLFLAEYRTTRQPIWAFGLTLCLLAISTTFQLWLALPLALVGWALLGEWRRAGFSPMVRDLIIVCGTVALFWLVLVLRGGQFVPLASRIGTGGNVAVPSFEALGGAFLLLPVAGLILARGMGERAAEGGMFLLFAAAQSAAMQTARLAGFSTYWAHKSFYLLILPLAIFAAFPLARLAARGETRLTPIRRIPIPALVTFCAVWLVLAGWIVWMYPPVPIQLFNESDIQVAGWAKEHLETRHVNYITRKSILANWLGIVFWNEAYPPDLLVDLATLGPKTYEEWRDDPDWGEYLFVSHQQNLPLDPFLTIVYQRGDSLIVQKPGRGRAERADRHLARLGNLFALEDSTPLPPTMFPGETLSLTVQVATGDLPTQAVVWRLQLRDLENNPIVETRHPPFEGKFPLHRWPDGVRLTQPLTLPLPLDIRPGMYDTQLGLHRVSSGEVVAWELADGTQDDVIHLGRIKVPLPPVTRHELGALTRTDVRLGDAFRLIGFRLRKVSPLHPGDSFQVILYWQCLTPAPDHTVFVHLLDSSGRLVAQRDSAPRGGTYPISIWDPHEIVPDTYELTMPHAAAPGDYALIVGMYQWPSLRRLPVTDAAQRPLGDHFGLPIAPKGVRVE